MPPAIETEIVVYAHAVIKLESQTINLKAKTVSFFFKGESSLNPS